MKLWTLSFKEREQEKIVNANFKHERISWSNEIKGRENLTLKRLNLKLSLRSFLYSTYCAVHSNWDTRIMEEDEFVNDESTNPPPLTKTKKTKFLHEKIRRIFTHIITCKDCASKKKNRKTEEIILKCLRLRKTWRMNISKISCFCCFLPRFTIYAKRNTQKLLLQIFNVEIFYSQ